MSKIAIPFIIMMFFGPRVSLAVDRITPSTKMDKNKPFPVYIQPGRSTTIDLPCSITSAVPGTMGDLKAEIGPEKDNSLLVWLLSDRSIPTNLIVRCGIRVLVFDIVPTRNSHQDYINITSIESSNSRRGLVASSSNLRETAITGHRVKTLIKASEEK